MTQIKNSAQKKKKCAKTKTKVITTYNYCGEDLECSDIKKGDSIQTVIEKLNAVACNGAGREYTFEDSEQCENGGFDVYENGNLIYTFCQECCGEESGYKYIDTLFWESGDVQINNTTAFDFVKIKDLLGVGSTVPTITATESGKYKITLFSGIGVEDSVNRFIIGIGLNDNPPVYNNLFCDNTVQGYESTERIVISPIFIVDMQTGDTADIYVKVDYGTINIDWEHKIIIEKIA